MTHTPGPWEQNLYRIFSLTKRIAEVETAKCTHDETIANARLMASAPAMLAALAQLVEEMTANEDGELLYGDWLVTARAAVEQATISNEGGAE